MRLRKLAAAFVLATAATASMSACGGEGTIGIEDVPGADVVAASTLETTIQGLGYDNVQVKNGVQDGPGADPNIKVLSATVGHPSLRGCSLNFEQKFGTADLPYFDAVITPKNPNGIEVPQANRTTLDPTQVLAFVASSTTECEILNTLAATPTP